MIAEEDVKVLYFFKNSPSCCFKLMNLFRINFFCGTQN